MSSDPPTDPQVQLRRTVAQVLLWIGTVGATALLFGTLVNQYRQGAVSKYLIAEIVGHVVLVSYGWLHRGTRRLQLSIVLYVLWISTFALAHYGPMLGVAPMFVIASVAALVFFGLRGAAWTLGATIGCIAIVGLAFNAGYVRPPPAYLGDVRQWSTWVRVSASMLIATGAVLAMLGYVLAALEGAERQARDALAREAEAMRAREESLRALADAQRLEALGRLAGGVAHDVNNALSVVLVMADMIQRRSDDEMANRCAEKISRAGKGAAVTTKQLLAFARRDLSRVDVEDAGRLLEEFGPTLEKLFPEDVAVEVDVPARGDDGKGALPVRIDSAQIEQALLNLAINAKDAMPSGGTLRLRARRVDNGGPPQVCIEVIDTGTGMDEETRERVFEPFFTTKPAGKGTGLGLAMVHGTVLQSGGEIDVDTAIGRGTTIRLSFPLALEDAEAVEEEVRSQPPRGTRVLLAEDRDDLRDAMGDSLRGAGYDVVVCNGVQEGLERLDDGPFDLLCTDAIMQDGATEWLISAFEEQYPSGVVLVCTGHVAEELVRRGIEAGRYQLLAKPFDGPGLVRAVDESLRV